MLLTSTALRPRHPVAYELHFGEELSDSILDGSFDFAQTQGVDPDLVAHLAVARCKGIALYGAQASEVLGAVPWSDFLDAILAGDLDWILSRENLLSSPFYGVLNACRILMTLACGPGTLVSKEEGALWALQHLPTHQHPVVQQALDVYRSPDWVPDRRMGGREWSITDLINFRDMVRQRLSSERDVTWAPTAQSPSSTGG